MKKEQARAYIEILENLKRDLAEDFEDQKKAIRSEAAAQIREKLERFASGVYVAKGDELLIIPMSSLEEIFKEFTPKKTDYPKCKHFILCSMDKQAFYKNTIYREDVFDTIDRIAKEMKEGVNNA